MPRPLAALAALLLAVATAVAQPQRKPEEEDPNAKRVNPPPQTGEEVGPPHKPAPAAKPAADPGGSRPPTGVLVVGIRDLPEAMSPAFARTAADRLAMDLVFESLVRPVVEPVSGLTYLPGLAAALPEPTAGGLAVELVPDAVWALPDGTTKPVLASDVRETVERLHNRAGQPGTELAERLEPVTSDSRFRCRVRLTQPAIDPLRALTFPVLPEFLPEDRAFAANPVGSGPFEYKGRKTFGGREYATFAANPHYGKRPSRRNLPGVREVWLLAAADPALDFRQGRVHLVVDATTPELVGLSAPGRGTAEPADDGPKLEVNLGVDSQVVTVPTRRIHYLAVNHAEVGLGGDVGRPLRRVLAHGIGREAVLDDVFRKGFKKLHAALGGPFPPNTWPCPPQLPPLDDAPLARGLAAGLPPRTLTLKYPDVNSDPLAERACKQMQAQLDGLSSGVKLKLEPLPAEQLRAAVFDHNRYELAYLTYEYADDWFDVSGLIAPKATGFGNRNALNLRGWQDVPLQRAAASRDFGEVQATLKRLHQAFQQDVPFVPLWCLDAHLVVTKGLRTTPVADQLDPQRPLRFVDDWRLR